MTARATYQLPPSFVDLELAEYLRIQVLAGAVRLDWSAVDHIDAAAVEYLLAGLDEATHGECLGLDTALPLFAATLRLGLALHPPAHEEQTPLLRPPPPAQLRAELEDALLRDLLGPAAGPEEELDERRVRDRYLVGTLAPKYQRVDPEQQDKLEVEDGADEDGLTDPSAPPPDTLFPSSLGLSCAVSAEISQIRVTARWGRYVRRPAALIPEGADRAPLIWKRVPMQATIDVELAPGPILPHSIHIEQPQVLLRGVVRRLDDRWLLSVFLVNHQQEPEERRDEAWLFQPELEIDDPKGRSIFVCRALEPTSRAEQDPELRAMDMLYRDRREFAVGHGAAVHADVDPENPLCARRVSTVIVPSHEVPLQDSRRTGDDPRLEPLVLDMRELAEAPRAELGAKLRALPDAYAAWIRRQRARLSERDARLGDFKGEAQAHLSACEAALGRIRDGLALLSADEKAAEAFRFANRAMYLQRLRTVFSEHRRRGDDVAIEALDRPEHRTWRVFQLAFILLNLDSTTSLHHPHRSDPEHAVADLLWFPTGGGKTEAYLGLAAYVMALRRLQGVVAGRSGEQGVAVLMRYTLRLLTLQQFQRAAALICACESIRRESLGQGDLRWGREPFRIGLWVGARSTPNRTDDAAEALKRVKVRDGRRPSSSVGGVGTPVQLANCPWCGHAIDPGRDIIVEPFQGGAGRTYMYCGDPRGTCLFSRKQSAREGLPVLVVDEEIYRRLPTLLIATVDKFAQMPWNGRVQTLFGQVTHICERHGFSAPALEDTDHPRRGDLPATRLQPHGPLRPPDLIIQDELHLISGPLGTLTGLYETAVDELCAWDVGGTRVRPKVIASTATIRRAAQQIRSLFLRDVHVFPPAGLDVGDNFFSLERPLSELPGRRYLGICAPGRRLKAALIRVYIALLSAAQRLFNRYGALADPWMTLVGYFNSLRELAGMRRMVDDDVRARLRRMDQRGLAARRALSVEELTSRLGSTEIPQLLDRLELTFKANLDDERVAYSRRPLDVLLATNMISVGVDVKRLGLMVTAGQPKTTAEYIQATSRVGRAQPGLVCTIYNWARPRDLSHYETFEHYHGTFYRHVEALSVTPFAARARDRGLAALLVSLVRLGDRTFARNEDAARIDRDTAVVHSAVDAIVRRATALEDDPNLSDQLRGELGAMLDRWTMEAHRSTGARLGYRTRNDGLTLGLLKPAGQGPWETFTCLNSLRDVEATASLLLADGGLDDEPVRPTGDKA